MFGRAPFAFYVAHLYLIHALRRRVRRDPGLRCASVPDASVSSFRKGYGVGLPGVYAVWLLVVAVAVPALPMGGRGQGAAPGLVAELPLMRSNALHGAAQKRIVTFFPS